jgi:PAS domain S-box-containing protein
LSVAAVVGCVTLLLALAVDHWYQATASDYERGRAVGMLSPRRAALENAINERMAVLRGVAAHLAVHWGTPAMAADFDAYAALIGEDEAIGVRSVQFVRNGVVSHTWPLDGNESALGRNLLEDPRPEISGDFRAALERGGIVLSGPTALYQGGEGLIGRLRARIPGDTVTVVAAVVLDFPLILSLSGLPTLDGLTWRLRDATGRVIAGTATLDTAHGGPVGLTVRLPDRAWQLDGVPAAGWPAVVGARRLPVRLGLGAAVLLAALLAWTLQSRRVVQHEAALSDERQRAEEKFRLLFQLVPDGVLLVRATDGVILEVNQALAKLLQRPREELLGRTVETVELWSSEAERVEGLRALAREGRVQEVRFGLRQPDGSRREGIYSASVVVVDGHPCRLSVIRDVHERIQMEQRLSESQRLEAIGRLAGGIAHDFNNIITGISGYATLAQQGLDDTDPRRADLGEITRAARRASDLTRQLLTFARRQVTTPQRVDLAELTRQAQGLLRQLAGETIALELDLPAAPVVAMIDPAQFEQVLTNLVLNACHAMPHGGAVQIRLETIGTDVVLSVADRGTGIAPEVLPHIFEPFFTTKAPGSGNGLGLSMVRGIVEEASGTIDVRSRVGQGSTFMVRLPVLEHTGAHTPQDGPMPVAPRGKGLVLMVEDEPQVRALTSRVLAQLGYEVLAAEDGTEALALAAAHHGPIALLLTDMVMPRMGGGELVRRMRELLPELPVLLMSGYSEELVAAEHPDHPFLAKPFTPAELAEAVRRVLAG